MRFSTSPAHRSLALLIVIGALEQPTHAADLTGFFVGGDFGRSQIDYGLSNYEVQLKDQASSFGALEFTSSSPRTRSNAWWADAGYMVWSNVGIEASFLHLGELTDRDLGTYTQTGGKPQPVIATTTLRSSGPALAALIRLPLMESLDVDIRIGDYLARARLLNGVDVNSYTVTAQSSRESSLLVGVGVAYTFGAHWSGRFDYLRVNKAGDSSTVGTYNVGLASLGASYTF